MKRCLVTGAFGLVGSNICKVLEEQYKDIEVTKVKCDEIPEATLLQDIIIFSSGYGQPQMFSEDKIKTIEINTTGLINAFRFLEEDGKFLFISSSEIYSGAPSPHKETDIGTTTPQHPRACYIEGKRCGEAICMAYKERGCDVKIARLALAYGPGTKKGDTRVLNQFIEQALTTGEIKMKDKGEAMRTYCYVDDAVGMIFDILFKGKDVVYNVGGVHTISIANLANEIAYITNTNFVPGTDNLYGSPDSVELDLSKIMNEFPRMLLPLEQGLIRTIEYQKQLYGIK